MLHIDVPVKSPHLEFCSVRCGLERNVAVFHLLQSLCGQNGSINYLAFAPSRAKPTLVCRKSARPTCVLHVCRLLFCTKCKRWFAVLLWRDCNGWWLHTIILYNVRLCYIRSMTCSHVWWCHVHIYNIIQYEWATYAFFTPNSRLLAGKTDAWKSWQIIYLTWHLMRNTDAHTLRLSYFDHDDLNTNNLSHAREYVCECYSIHESARDAYANARVHTTMQFSCALCGVVAAAAMTAAAWRPHAFGVMGCVQARRTRPCPSMLSRVRSVVGLFVRVLRGGRVRALKCGVRVVVSSHSNLAVADSSWSSCLRPWLHAKREAWPKLLLMQHGDRYRAKGNEAVQLNVPAVDAGKCPEDTT